MEGQRACDERENDEPRSYNGDTPTVMPAGCRQEVRATIANFESAGVADTSEKPARLDQRFHRRGSVGSSRQFPGWTDDIRAPFNRSVHQRWRRHTRCSLAHSA
jgi:hypothetical protein